MHVVAHAPVRTADLGGWTDTWFAASGAVCSVAVEPGVTVELSLGNRTGGDPRIALTAGGRNDTFTLGNDPAPPLADRLVVAAIRRVRPPGDLEVRVESGVPAGSGLGTSAAVAVSLLAGLHSLHGRVPDRTVLAREAHTVETSLGLQSGVQDQLSAAFGGTHLFDIAYPDLAAPARRVPDATVTTLGRSLVTVYLGRPHRSSELHEQVIASLEEGDNEHRLQPLRLAAKQGFDALMRGDLDAYGLAMRANHAAQKALHPALISDLADRTIAVARDFGVRGWKVNGAGGEGGSLCLLAPVDPDRRQHMLDALSAIDDVFPLDLRVSLRGVEVVVG